MERKKKAKKDTKKPVKKVENLPVEETVEETVEEVIKQDIPLEEKVYTWKKHTPGILHTGSKIIKPNQTFQAKISGIPKRWRHLVTCLDNEDMEAEEAVIKATLVAGLAPVFTLKKLDNGLFDILSKIGKPINGEPMAEVDAQALLTTLLS